MTIHGCWRAVYRIGRAIASSSTARGNRPTPRHARQAAAQQHLAELGQSARRPIWPANQESRLDQWSERVRICGAKGIRTLDKIALSCGNAEYDNAKRRETT